MFAVDRDQPSAALFHRLDEEVAGGDEAFLVGERDIGAAGGSLQGRGKPGGADDRGHHPAGIHVRGLFQPACAGCDIRAGARQQVLQRPILAFVGGDGELRACAASLFRKQSRLPLPVSAMTSKLSRPPSCAMTSSVLTPIEPVEPRTERRRGRALSIMLLTSDCFMLRRLYKGKGRPAREVAPTPRQPGRECENAGHFAVDTFA